jgi:hypothetical protein
MSGPPQHGAAFEVVDALDATALISAVAEVAPDTGVHRLTALPNVVRHGFAG